MTEMQMLTIAAALVATMFGILATVLGWIGSRLHTKVDDMGKTLHSIAEGLHEKFNGLDKRVTVVETMMRDTDRPEFSRHP